MLEIGDRVEELRLIPQDPPARGTVTEAIPDYKGRGFAYMVKWDDGKIKKESLSFLAKIPKDGNEIIKDLICSK